MWGIVFLCIELPLSCYIKKNILRRYLYENNVNQMVNKVDNERGSGYTK